MNKELDKKILNNLSSQKSDIVITTLEYLSEKGSSEYIPYLADVLQASKDDDIRTKIIMMLSNIKQKDAANELVLLLQNKQYQEEWKTIAQCCWSNGLDYTPYLSVFVDLVINEPFETALEAFTVIENMDGFLSSDEKTECLHKIQSAINKGKPSEQQSYFLNEMIPIIDKINEKEE